MPEALTSMGRPSKSVVRHKERDRKRPVDARFYFTTVFCVLGNLMKKIVQNNMVNFQKLFRFQKKSN
jgi:hypothetical protein